mmetsp:Transcript_18536/g.28016  ORF Transcript_18536/g.28016 Transcript_18536/m.28016 type:complete len:205 (+) Transcript_18536:227-841(+)|eukprot:CAMPEP_0178912656 /NCGR_PEP_ID=MMETSP0786-20121207/10394_1 /TAXON_ID=186022 /ORGANISM="Thalassionema frauenfeldii, Strain CCMP 1798" /LENGTH=204 /DNA_ID=CAMNT_0020585283 /DNA_START=182 /DNA_END=796 /DNA_ORIENTATION=-
MTVSLSPRSTHPQNAVRTSSVVRTGRVDSLDSAIDHFVQMCISLKKDQISTAEEGNAFLLELAHKMNAKAAHLRKQVQGSEQPLNPFTNGSECRSLVINNNSSFMKEEETTVIFRPRTSMLHEARYSMPLWENFVVAANVYAEDQGIDCRNLKFVDEDGSEYDPSNSLKELGFTDDKQVVHVHLNFTKVEEETKEVQELEEQGQ